MPSDRVRPHVWHSSAWAGAAVAGMGIVAMLMTMTETRCTACLNIAPPL
ncbi:hypothetical protein GA0115259_112294 [Streptomyces sp. MnatMP-M17]|nr:hypothetical protein GA0115259_112294 [Streptomyces sp. MnatMP-M17]